MEITQGSNSTALNSILLFTVKCGPKNDGAQRVIKRRQCQIGVLRKNTLTQSVKLFS